MADVPGRFDISIDGVGYQLHEDGEQPALIHQSIRQQREQTSSQGNIGEAVVNPEGFWRRSRDSWHAGAGQRYADRAESNDLRFYDSQGVNVFDVKHQVTLLRDTDSAYTFASGIGYLKRVSTYVYLRDNLTIKYVADPLTVPWSTTTVTTTGGNNGFEINGLASDGNTIFIAFGSDGIYTTTPGAATGTSYITGTANEVFWCKGRLLATNGPAVYNPVTGGALPSALLTLTSGFNWVDMAEGPNHIYMLAKNNSNTIVYKTQVKADGTALDVPTVAAELPNGEDGWAIYGYVGKIFVATTYGVRMASVDSNGNLVLGATIPAPLTGNFFNAFHGRNQFVWYGIKAISGLGRLDLTTETLPNTPAYAADIVATGVTTKHLTAIESFGDQKVFVARGAAYLESATEYVASGYIDSGLLALDLADAKTPVALDVEAAYPSTTSITEAISVDRGASFTTIDTWDSGDQGEQAISGVAASRQFELRTTLTANAAATSTPTLYRHTLKVEPNVNQSDYIIARLRLFESVVDNTGAVVGQNPSALRAGLRTLQQARSVVTLVEGDVSYSVTLRDMDDQYQTRCASADDGDWNSVATVRMKVIV